MVPARFLLVLSLGLGDVAGCARPRPAETAPAVPPPTAPPVAPAPPPPPPVSLACRGKAQVCAEYQGVAPDDATKLRQQCTTEGGELLEACPPDKVVGACMAARPTMTVRQVVYRAKTARETRGLVALSKRACEGKGGTFTAP